MSSNRLDKSVKHVSAISKQLSSRDLPAHTKLKYRQPGQNTSDDLKKKNYRKELEEKERLAIEERNERNKNYRSGHSSLLSIKNEEANSEKLALPSSKKIKTDHLPIDIDADDPVCLSNDEDEVDKSDSDDDSDDDETADLLAELNKIKKERAIENAKKEAEEQAKEERIRIENILHGNPLKNNNTEFKVKRRWDDDVVFKNCSREDIDEKDKPFINDTLRSEFHKKFMEKYIK